MTSVYIAAPMCHREIAQRVLRPVIEAENPKLVQVISTWHRGGDTIPGDDWTRADRRNAWRRIWERNHAEVAKTDVLFVYDPAGQGRETYAEVFAAVQAKKPIVMVGQANLTIDAYAAADVFTDLLQAIRALDDLTIPF